MAVLKSIATGNLTDAVTWGLVDATSYLNAETGNETLTTAFSGTRSQAFTPGAITVEGIAVKLAQRVGTTGIISVHLALNATHTEVAGTLVTINCSDLPAATSAVVANGGWVYFKFATPILLLAATAYEVEATTSSANQVALFRDGTADNISRALVTTTTQAPVAGDDMIVAGEYTGAGASATITVTMNETATTDYGSASTSLVTPALAVCGKGVLTYGTTAATNYYLKLSGNAIVYADGTFNIGTTGTPIPRDSTAVLEFDCTASGDFGISARNGATWNSQGLSRTSGKNVVSCKLNTNEAADSTSLGVDTDTGWLDNDEIAIASTSQTYTECEDGLLNGNAGASSLTVDGFAGAGGGLDHAHSGTSPTQAEMILLTRNVKIRGTSTSTQAFVYVGATATVDIDWTQFYFLGSGISDKDGFSIYTTTGTLNVQFSSLHDFTGSGARGFGVAATSGTGITLSNNVSYNITTRHLVATTAGMSIVFTNHIALLNTATTTSIIELSAVGGTITNITAVGCSTGTLAAISMTSVSTIGTINTLTAHSNAGFGISLASMFNGTISDIVSWRNSLIGGLRILTGLHDITLSNVTLFGNNPANFVADSNVGKITINGFVSNGDTTFSTQDGMRNSGSGAIVCGLKFNSPDFSTVSGIKTAHTNDINISSSSCHIEILLVNPKLGGTNEVVTQSNLGVNSFVAIQRKDQTNGAHRTLKKAGTIIIETTTVHTGATAFSMTPTSASEKLVSGSFFIPVASGATLTPSVYVQENAAYNGARARLILKRNDAIGITSDTVIDTATAASDEAWEQLTGTTAAASDDGVMEFVVDVDGTAGILFVDSFTTT